MDHKLVFVAHVNPMLAAGGDDVLGELTEAYDKEWMPGYNLAGAGAFKIPLASSEFDYCAQGNYIRVYRDSVAGDLLGGFFIETAGDNVISVNEQGGEVSERAGMGSLSVLFWAVMQNDSDLGTELANVSVPDNDPDGMWHWTDRPPGAILVRQLEEAQARGRFPFVSYDFDRDLDSDGNAWASSAGDVFKVAVGTRLWRGGNGGQGLIDILADVGLVVKMDGNFNLQAWDTEQGDDLTADIVFEKGTNIRGDVNIAVAFNRTISTVLVAGDIDETTGDRIYATATGLDGVDLEALFGIREGFASYPNTSSTSKLQRGGVKVLNKAYTSYLGIPIVAILERDDEVPLLHYFPGDTVTLDVGTYPGSPFERRIRKIRFFDRDNDEYDIDIEFDEADHAELPE